MKVCLISFLIETRGFTLLLAVGVGVAAGVTAPAVLEYLFPALRWASFSSAMEILASSIYLRVKSGARTGSSSGWLISLERISFSPLRSLLARAPSATSKIDKCFFLKFFWSYKLTKLLGKLCPTSCLGIGCFGPSLPAASAAITSESSLCSLSARAKPPTASGWA